jgi:2',3'-cyclic-nucleotide 2'-phosphodiesterase (5'-nucleotidase family)
MNFSPQVRSAVFCLLSILAILAATSFTNDYLWGEQVKPAVKPEIKTLTVTPSLSPRKDDKIRLRIVSFNDFHGTFREKNFSVGAAKFVTALNEYKDRFKKDYPTALCVFSGGDNFSGTALAYYSMLDEATGKEKPTDMLNQLFIRINLVSSCLGNHEFDWGPDFLNSHLSNATVGINEKQFKTFSSSNVIDKRTNAPPGGIPSYDVISIDGYNLKFTVITLTTMETALRTSADETKYFEFEKPGNAAKILMDSIRDVDGFIFLAHLASYQDDKKEITFGRDSDDMLDLVRLKPMAIISAHSHQFVSGQMNDVPIIQAGCYANGLASIDFIIDTKTKAIAVESQEFVKLLPKRNDLQIDTETEKAVDKIEADCHFSKVGTVRNDLIRDRRRFTDIGALIAKAVSTAYRETTKDEPVLGFQHSGGIRDNLSKGDITEEDCYDILPFQGGLDLCRLSGSKVIQLLRAGFINQVGYLQSYALKFYYDNPDVPKEKFNAVSFTFQGKEQFIESEKEYWVVLDNFVTSGGDNYGKDIFEGSIVHSHGPLSRDILVRFFRENLQDDIHLDENDRVISVIKQAEP